MKLFTATAAAKEIGISRTTISAMKRIGLKFSHGRWTKLEAVLDWMAKNPDFRFAAAYPHRPKPSKPASTRSGRSSCKSGESR